MKAQEELRQHLGDAKSVFLRSGRAVTSGSTAIRLYQAMLLLSLPGAIWTAFETYGLTLSGPQMLFYSIIHTSPVLSFVVFVSCVFFLGFMVVAGAFLFSDKLRGPLNRNFVALVLLAQSAHILLCLSYGTWSQDPWLRIVICIVGLTIMTAGYFVAILTALANAESGNQSEFE